MFSLLESVPALTRFISNEKLVLIGTVSLLLWLYVHRKWSYFKRQGLPFVEPTVLGLGSLVPFMTRPFEFDLENKNKLGPVYGTYSMLSPCIAVYDPEMLREICIKQFHNFSCRMDSFNKTSGNELNNGLDKVKGRQWKRMRSSLTPIFSSGKLRQMHDILNVCGNDLMEVLNNKILNEDGMLDSKEVLGRYTLNVLLSAAFNTSICNQDGEEPEVVKQAKILLDVSVLGNPLILLVVLFPSFENIMAKFNMSFFDKKALAYFNKLSKAIMKRQKETPTADKVDMMRLMLEVQKTEEEVNDPDFDGKGMTEVEIIGNAMLMVLAGYENVSYQLSYLAYNIAMHPEVQDKLLEEVDEAVDENGDISYTALNDMKYLEMCLNESSRLYAPLLKNSRSCSHDTVIKGVQFKKGMLVLIPTYAIHHDPEFWPQPFEFRPDRMSDMTKIDPMTLQPFGNGPRNCIAMRFAKIEVKMGIAKILSKYRILPGPDTPEPPLELTFTSTVKPKIPIVLKIEPRKDNI